MADPFEPCTGEIWEGDPLEPDCTCFKKKGPTLQVDGGNASELTFATGSTPEAGYKLMKFNADNAIAHNTEGLKICRWKALAPLRAGIKSNCGDIYIQVRFIMTGTYPVELTQTIVDWNIKYRKKYKDKESPVVFPFADTFTFNQRSFPPNVHPNMNISISDLTVQMDYEGDNPCLREATLWSATVTDDQATNDAGFQPPERWDPNGSTYNNESVHPDGHIGIDWLYYNTLVRFGEITYGPTIAAQFLLTVFEGSDSDPYGFTTTSKFVSGPF